MTSWNPTTKWRCHDEHEGKTAPARPPESRLPALVRADRRHDRRDSGSGDNCRGTAVELPADDRGADARGQDVDRPERELGQRAHELLVPVAAVRRLRRELQLDRRGDLEDLHGRRRRRRSPAPRRGRPPRTRTDRHPQPRSRRASSRRARARPTPPYRRSPAPRRSARSCRRRTAPGPAESRATPTSGSAATATAHPVRASTAPPAASTASARSTPATRCASS